MYGARVIHYLIGYFYRFFPGYVLPLNLFSIFTEADSAFIHALGETTMKFPGLEIYPLGVALFSVSWCRARLPRVFPAGPGEGPPRGLNEW